MTEDGKGICCIGFLSESVCSRESKTRLIIWHSDYFKGVADALNIRQRTDVWRWEWGVKRLTIKQKPRAMTWRDRVGFCWNSGQGTMPSVATKSPLFCFFSSSAVCPRLAAPFCQSTSLSSAPAFRFPAVALPPCCLSPLIRIPNPLLHQGWRVSTTYCGYKVDPGGFYGGILPGTRVHLGTGHGGGTVVKVCWPSEW